MKLECGFLRKLANNNTNIITFCNFPEALVGKNCVFLSGVQSELAGFISSERCSRRSADKLVPRPAAEGDRDVLQLLHDAAELLEHLRTK